MIQVRPNDREPEYTIKALDDGDFVHVAFIIGGSNNGFFARVLKSSSDHLRILAHQVTSDHIERATCLGWELVIPWTSILWVRHLPGTPVNCKCMEGS